MSKISIHPKTSLGHVTLTVSDLGRSSAFYQQAIGLRPIDGDASRLGADGVHPLVVLGERQGATRKPADTTGLYHFAILVPTRKDLALSLARLATNEIPLQGAADHLVSEALYLSDPDGNGIEIYRDRPRADWQWDGSMVVMDSLRFDLQGLLGELGEGDDPNEPISPGTVIGHVHLSVPSLEDAAAFYVDKLGFERISKFPGALFVSAGGYHHHLGLNTWAGKNPPGSNSTGLANFEIQLPDQASLVEVAGRLAAEVVDGTVVTTDPFGNVVLLVAH